MSRIIRYRAIGIALLIIMLAGSLSGTDVRASEKTTLKVALLPIFDVLPYYVAKENGWFSHMKYNIEAVPVGSAVERDQLLQAGEIDGVVNEMISVANFNREKVQAVVVSSARKSRAGAPLFRILAAPGGGMSQPIDLAGVPIGVSKNTIIEYVTDRLLTDQGLNPQQIRKQSVPVIPERFQLLLQGQVKAAVLPDPLAQSAILAGAVEIMNDAAYAKYSTSVVTFSKTAVDTKADAIRFFLEGWTRAAKEINRRPKKHRDILLKHIRVPKNLQKTVRVPPYPVAEVPSAAQWADVLDWMRSKGLVDTDISYASSVTGAFLPKP